MLHPVTVVPSAKEDASPATAQTAVGLAAVLIGMPGGAVPLLSSGSGPGSHVVASKTTNSTWSAASTTVSSTARPLAAGVTRPPVLLVSTALYAPWPRWY